jgi:hypothetical protein
MFFNNDLLFVVGSIIVGSVFTYTFYNNIFTTVNKSESLVNTNSSLDTSNELSNNLQYVDASVQTANINVDASIQTANTYVNTGMQTSARMWLESIRNWITEILGTPNPQYVDVGVQTNAPSTWGAVKQWFLEVYSIRSSELSSIGYSKVQKWINKINPSANNSSTVESNKTISSVNSDSSLQQLVNPYDSASNVSEVILESNLQNLEITSNVVNSIYDITDQEILASFMDDPSVYSYFDIADQIHYVVADTLLTVDPSIMNCFM